MKEKLLVCISALQATAAHWRAGKILSLQHFANNEAGLAAFREFLTPHTNVPVYVTVDHQPPRSPADATYFVTWLDRVLANATARNDYNSAQEKHDTLQYLGAARAVFQARTEQSN